MLSFLKICIILHEAEQVLNFQIFKIFIQQKVMNIFKIAFIHFSMFVFINYVIDIIILIINANLK